MKKLLLLLSLVSISTQGLANIGDVYMCEIVNGALIFKDYPTKEFGGSLIKFKIEENSIRLMFDVDDESKYRTLNIIKDSKPAFNDDPYDFFIASSEQPYQGEFLKFHKGNLVYSNLGSSTAPSIYIQSFIANCEIL